MTTAAARRAPPSRRSWHATILVVSLVVVVASVLLDTTAQTVSFFGDPIPPLCVIRRLTGYRCPGCGLTRAFVFMGHGDPLSALRMNLMGPLMWVLVAAQVPYRAKQLMRGNAAAPDVSQ
ncbi:MAG: DUF2752 domain-containing protein [Alphaproteobacteria bacterium]|nr:DUF2752 domain-containing protein [Alphaproteobacteria bacterium]